MAKKSTHKQHGILYYVGLGLSVGLFALVVLIGALAVVVPAATGSTPFTVLTGSMTPAYPPGTLIIVSPIDAKDIRLGDVVTYQIESGKPAVVTHRVVSITTSSNGDRSFHTKGDANNTVDEKAVRPEQVRGKVWYAIPYLGYVNQAVNGQARVWLIPLIAIGLFAYVGYLAASTIVSRLRTSPKGSETDVDTPREPDSSGDADGLSREHGRRAANRH